MPTFYGASTAFTPSKTNARHLYLTTSVVAGTNKKNIAVIPAKSWEMDLNINSTDAVKKAVKKFVQTTHEVAKLQGKSSEEIKIPFVLGCIKGFNMEKFFQTIEKALNPKHVIGESRTICAKFRTRFEKQIDFLYRGYIGDPSKKTDKEKFAKLVKEAEDELLPTKKIADAGNQVAFGVLRNEAKNFAKSYAEFLKENETEVDPKFILVIHPLSFMLDWFDLREIFCEQLKQTMRIKGNFIVKKPDDPDVGARYYSDVARAFVMDEMDLHFNK